MEYKDVVIVAAKRTAVGRFGGSLKDLSAVEIGSQLVQGILDSLAIPKEEYDEVIFGNVISAGLGQNMARQISIKAGLPVTVPAYTVSQVCGSGMKAVMLGAQSIEVGENELVVVGGCENMSQAPYYLTNQRWGSKLGHQQVYDSILVDGLTDAFSLNHMGLTAEYLAEHYQISRKDQDIFALSSHQKAEKAQKELKFVDEIIPIKVTNKKKEQTIFSEDEGIRHGQTLEALQKLKPVFKKEGSVTAGNASPINDGAACLVLASRQKARELGLPILASIRSSGKSGLDPQAMGMGPVKASLEALTAAKLQSKDIDLFELNEAFAAQCLSCLKELNWPRDCVNVNGGAISLGHAIGCSGSRILVTLLYEMKRQQVKYGLASLCIGGGQGNALILERE